MKCLSDVNLLGDKDAFGLSLGNFDGVHLGHQRLIKNALNDCQRWGGKLVVMSFNPHPLEFLKGVEAFYINTFKQKRGLLKDLKVDYLVELPFNRNISELHAQAFFEHFIFKIPRLKKIFLGYDFRLGKDKKGTLNIISKIVKKHSIDLRVQEEFLLDGEEVSSSRIRALVKRGLVDQACKLLGRHFFLEGEIISGMGRGRTIGFPTLNLAYDKRSLAPQNGVYLTRTLIDNVTYSSLTNVGINPTFVSDKSIKIESHLLEFGGCYKRSNIKVSFIKKLRDEKRFVSGRELALQIARDIEASRGFFK
jgi:riboflavin kinase/FMN adenylyltransferase